MGFDDDPALRPWHNRWLSGEPQPSTPHRPFTMRPYQTECVDAVFGQWDSGVRVTQVVKATGLGKTVAFVEVARRCKGKVLIVVHREVLLQQTVQKLLEHTGDHVGIERASSRAFGEKYVVCTMQTAAMRLNRVGARREFDAIIIDECFVQGTLVDGYPIEDYEQGHHVGDHGIVWGVGSRPAPDILVTISGCTSTSDHPYLTPDGWKKAGELRAGDLYCVRRSDFAGPRESLAEDVFCPVSVAGLFRNHVSHQQASRLCKNAGAQSNAESGDAGKGCGHSQAERSRAERARRQWPWAYASGVPACCGHELAYECDRAYREESEGWASDALQDRRGLSGAEGGDRGGRGESSLADSARAGQAEDGVFAWARVDSVEVHERGGAGRYGEVCPDGLVYNLTTGSGCFELGNGALVHNSHHSDTDVRYRHIVDYFDKARVVCFTATPKFSTKLLVPETLAYYMDIKKGTADGWLCPLVGDRLEIEEFTLRELSAWSDEFDEGEVPEWMVAKVAPLRDILMDRYPKRRGILFTDTVRQAFILNEALNSTKAGLSVMMSHHTSKEQREKYLKMLRNKRARFFCNVGIAVEGFDWPDADLVALGGETSWHTYVQKVGRVTRPLAGVVDGLDSAIQRRGAIAKSAKPNGLVLEMFPAGKPPDLLRMTGPKLEEAYKDGVAQLKQVMEVTCRLQDEERDDSLLEQHNQRQLQQADKPVMSIDSETVYNVASYDVQKRVTDVIRERESDGNDRAEILSMRVEPAAPKPPPLKPAREGWEKLPVTGNQRRTIECRGLVVPEDATKQWASWVIDILCRGRGDLDPWKLDQINSIPVDGIQK